MWLIADPAYPVVPASGVYPSDGHLVSGEGACLVRAYDGGASERLRRWQSSYQRVLPRHRHRAESKSCDHGRRQPLRYSGDDQPNRGQKHMVEFISEQHPHDEVDQAEHGDYDDQKPSKAGYLLHYGGSDLVGSLHHPGDLAYLRPCSRLYYDSVSAASGDEGAAKADAVLASKPDVRFFDMIDAFGHGGRFAGQHRFVCAHLFYRKQTEVGRYPIAAFKQNHIARNQLSCRDGLLFTVPQHDALRHHHFLEGLKGCLGLALLNEAYDHSAENYADDDAHIHELAEEDADDGGEYEDVEQRIMELQEKPDERAAFFYLKFVIAVSFQSGFCFARREPHLGAFQRFKNLLRRQLVPAFSI